MPSSSAAPSPLTALAAGSLRWAGLAWFSVAAAGQIAFIAFILAFYGVRTVSGDFAAWNDKPLIKGYLSGDDVGNGVFAAHVLLAAVLTLAGLMQFVPGLRRARPRLHRWTGRVFLVLAAVMASSGVWLAVVRETYLSPISAIAILLNAVLIPVCGALAWREALRRRFESHRRWAMRTFMVVSGVWFLRVGLMGWVVLNGGPVGMTDDMSGPADIVLTFGSYLIPLAILETWFAATRARSPVLKGIGSLMVGAATVYTAVGVFGAIAFMWAPYL